MTIWFIPQRYLAFINAYRSLLNQYQINERMLFDSGSILFNKVLELGGVIDTGHVKTIINAYIDLYPVLNKRMQEYFWNVEQRPAMCHEISEFYEVIVLAIQLFVQDLLLAQSRALTQPSTIKSLEITPLGGTIHV